MTALTNPDNPTATFTLDFEDGEPVTITLEFHFSENAEEYFNISDIVNGIASAIALELGA